MIITQISHKISSNATFYSHFLTFPYLGMNNSCFNCYRKKVCCVCYKECRTRNICKCKDVVPKSKTHVLQITVPRWHCYERDFKNNVKIDRCLLPTLGELLGKAIFTSSLESSNSFLLNGQKNFTYCFSNSSKLLG